MLNQRVHIGELKAILTGKSNEDAAERVLKILEQNLDGPLSDVLYEFEWPDGSRSTSASENADDSKIRSLVRRLETQARTVRRVGGAAVAASVVALVASVVAVVLSMRGHGLDESLIVIPAGLVEEVSELKNEKRAIFTSLDGLERKQNRTIQILRESAPVVAVHPDPRRSELPADVLEVGNTKDACSMHNIVQVQGRNGPVVIMAGESQIIELPRAATELIWRCGDTKERAANDTPFTHVLCDRATNGAISWKFYFKEAR